MEGKVQIILQKHFIFRNFSQMQKRANFFQNLLSDECHSISSISPLAHQLLGNTVKLNPFVHLMSFAAFCLVF